ncbi:MAG TPA: DUF1674 domain-containing protein [Woeseiaceae bacterium]
MPDEPNAQLTSSNTSSSTAGSTAGDAAADSVSGEAVEATLPSAVRESHVGQPAQRHPDPTRYGDWEKGGRCIDF